jgi:hypothetical protein
LKLPKALILPLLVSGGNMPPKKDLPSSIRALADRNAVEVRPDPDFRHHIGRVIAALDRRFGNTEERTNPLSEDEIFRRVTALQPDRWRQMFGLREIRSSFHGFSFEHLLRDSIDLLVVMNDGRSWIDSHRELLATRIANPKLSTRVMFVHPSSPFIDVLIRKNGKSKTMQLEELQRSLQILERARQPNSNLDVRGHYCFNPYVLHISEREAVLSPYLLGESGALPLFVFVREATDAIYLRLREDAEQTFQGAEPLSSSNSWPVDEVAKVLKSTLAGKKDIPSTVVRPNIIPVKPHLREVYLDAANKLFARDKPAPSSDRTQHQTFQAIVVGFRNDAPTRPVYGVKARISLSGVPDYPLTGCWLGSTADHVDLEPGAASEEVIVAISGNNIICVVNDRRDKWGNGTVEILRAAGKGVTSPDTFQASVELSADGEVLLTTEIDVTIRPFLGAAVTARESGTVTPDFS